MESILSETTQKSQESQQALELLFEEKKKVKQLEQQLLIAHKEKALHNENLKKSIETQFVKLKLNNLKANNAYSVVFNFKTV